MSSLLSEQKKIKIRGHSKNMSRFWQNLLLSVTHCHTWPTPYEKCHRP